MAVGATPISIVRMVLQDALAMVGMGLALGVPLVIWSRPLAAQLVEDLHIANAAPIILGMVVVLVVALSAASLPARRAARVDPIEALRHE